MREKILERGKAGAASTLLLRHGDGDTAPLT